MNYKLPNLDILPNPPEELGNAVNNKEANLLEEHLEYFGVKGEVSNIVTGPIVTRYEVSLHSGIKVSQIANLSNDLAMTLKAKSVRIIAPVPGKSVVGIEVPNQEKNFVFIKNIFNSFGFIPKDDTILLALGVDTSGSPRIINLVTAPHLLIAGQTGSGKSVAVNAFLASILMTKTPEEVNLILIDPKIVELAPYNSIPHLLSPVITQPDKAIKALNWATYTMDKRYDILASEGVRNIQGYNQKILDGRSDKDFMPYIVIVIDEFADLMAISKKEIESFVMRLTQKARAVGMHLILTTQRPSTDVVTGVIKANLPTRIGFQTASQIDSKTILDVGGCEKLIGNGDMLLKSVGSLGLERMHGSFIQEEETNEIIKVWEAQNNRIQIKELDIEEENKDIPKDDPRLQEAIRLIKEHKYSSASLFQRKMNIGYERSQNIFLILQHKGIIS